MMIGRLGIVYNLCIIIWLSVPKTVNRESKQQEEGDSGDWDCREACAVIVNPPYLSTAFQ